MTKFEKIKAEWTKAFNEMNESPGFKRLREGTITKEHYVALMKQLFLQVRENGSLQASCTNRFKGPQRKLVKMFMKHAVSEVGHDQLIVDDLKAMGEDITDIDIQRPIPSVMAMISFPYYLINHENPISYLGFIFHLEFMPTSMGWNYIDCIKKIGVPDEAFSFISEHAEVDIAHNKLMKRYIEELIQTEEDLSDVIYAAKVAARYYAQSVTEVFDAVDRKQIDWGVDWKECAESYQPSVPMISKMA